MVLLRKIQNVLGHGPIIVLNPVLLVEQGGGAVAHGVEQIRAGPVKDGHEIVADDFHAELA